MARPASVSVEEHARISMFWLREKWGEGRPIFRSAKHRKSKETLNSQGTFLNHKSVSSQNALFLSLL